MLADNFFIQIQYILALKTNVEVIKTPVLNELAQAILG